MLIKIKIYFFESVSIPDLSFAPTQGIEAAGEILQNMNIWGLSSTSADDVSYDNIITGLTANTVQEAIDQLDTGGGGGAVLSVNGKTGAVALSSSDIPEGTKLYYTDARADARITAQKGAANGVAELDGTTKVPIAQLPDLFDGQYGDMIGQPTTVDCATQNVWYGFTGLSGNISNGITFVDNVTADRLLIAETGDYMLNVSISCSIDNGGSGNRDMEFGIFHNDIQDTSLTVGRRFSNNDIGSVNICGLIALTAGEYIDIRVRKTSNTANQAIVENIVINYTVNGTKVLNQAGGGGSGDVTGPASSTDNAICSFDSTTGKIIQNSSWTITPSGLGSSSLVTGEATAFISNSVGSVWVQGTTTTTISANTLTELVGPSIGFKASIVSTNGYTIPVVRGTNGQVLQTDGAGVVSWATVAGSGDVTGPGSSTDNAICRFDSTTGKIIQNSGITVSDTNFLTMPANADIVLSGNGRVNTPSVTTLSVDSDLGLTLLSGSAKGISVADGANGEITLTGDLYQGNAGQFLQVDATGNLSCQSGGVPATTSDLTTASGQTYTTGANVPYTLTLNHVFLIGTLDASLFSASTGSVTISDVVTTNNPVITFNAQFDTADATMTLTYNNTGGSQMKNALATAFPADAADNTVNVEDPVPTSTALYTFDMSNNTTPSPWVTSASSEDSSEAWEAFNRTATDGGDVWISTTQYDYDAANIYIGSAGLSTYDGEWLCVTDTSDEIYQPLRYTLTPRNSVDTASVVKPPTDWVVLGTTDTVNTPTAVTTWVLLDTQVGVTFSPINVGQTFTIDTPGIYSRFAFVFQKLMPATASGTNDNKCGIGTITFLQTL